jgi:hypothetical protein
MTLASDHFISLTGRWCPIVVDIEAFSRYLQILLNAGNKGTVLHTSSMVHSLFFKAFHRRLGSSMPPGSLQAIPTIAILQFAEAMNVGLS